MKMTCNSLLFICENFPLHAFRNLRIRRRNCNYPHICARNFAKKHPKKAGMQKTECMVRVMHAQTISSATDEIELHLKYLIKSKFLACVEFPLEAAAV